MTTQTVTAAYLLGIKEGRAFLRANPGLSIDGMRACLATSQLLLRSGFSGDVAEMFRGERDFWKNQIKRAS